ncbi:MAG: tetratricopeptide repeat protein [Chloroflexi bacterium]|nr:tetratricopeptide repeat protein [Chloroflexota bacterium]
MERSWAPLHISLFGYPVLRRVGREVPFESAKVRALLAYLLLHTDTPQARDYLAYLLWPDVPNETARKNLRQALYSLRKALGPEAERILDIQRDTVRLRAYPIVWVDVWEFDRLERETRSHPHRAYGTCPYCRRRYEAMLALYQGEFLHGFSVRDAEPFEEWATEQREHYRQRALHVVHQAVRYYYLRGDYGQAETWARRWLHWDPWSEAAYAYLIRALALQGRKGAALRVYRDYARMMREELGLELPEDAERLIYDVRHNLLPEPESARQRAQLPQSPHPLVGREAERDDVLARLARPDTRLITLVGPGGIGKTRLAEELARESLTLFPDGVYWVPLAAAHDADEALAILRENLQPGLQSGPERDDLVRALSPKRALLVLDDVPAENEWLIRWVQDVLRAGREVVILATARQPLRLRSEQRVLLPGLAYPTAKDEPLTPEEAGAYPAVALFVARAQQVVTHFRLSAQNLPAVLDIVRFTQGLPLALELAAAQVAQAPCEQVAATLRQAALDIQAPYRDQPPHHRSLRVLFERTWAGLSEPMRRALVRLAGFGAAFDAEMAAAVAQIPSEMLSALAQHSLLTLHEGLEGRPSLWEMHPLTRAFAREHWDAAADERAAWQARARAWVAQTLRSLRAEQGFPIWRLAALRPALNAYMEDLLERSPQDEIEAVVAGLVAWFRYYGRSREGAAYLERLLARVQQMEPWPAQPRLVGRLMRLRGLLAYLIGDLTTAQTYFQQAQEHLRPFPEARGDYARTLQGLAGVYQMFGDLEKAEQLEAEALDLFRAEAERGPHEAPSPGEEYWVDAANALNNLGGIAFHRGDLEAARRYFQEAVAYYRRAGTRGFLVNTLSNLAFVLLSEERTAEAQEVAEEALRVAQSLGAQRELANILGTLGTIAIHREDLSMAHLRLRRALHIARRADLPELSTTFETNLGIVLKNLQRPTEAEKHYQEAVRQAQAHGLRYNECSARIFYASFLLDEERLAEAEEQLRRALRLAVEHHFEGLRDKVFVFTVRLWHQQQRQAQALALLLWLKEQNLTGNDRLTLSEWERSLFRKPGRALRAEAETWRQRMDRDAWVQAILGDGATDAAGRTA